MKNLLFNQLRTLFVVSLCACMLLGALLTAAQFVGAILFLPDLITGSEKILLKPVIISAAAFGVFSFFASYFQPGGKSNDEEEEEI